MQILAAAGFLWSSHAWGEWADVGLEAFTGSPDAAYNAEASHGAALWSQRFLFAASMITVVWMVARARSNLGKRASRPFATLVLAVPLAAFTLAWLLGWWPLPAMAVMPPAGKQSFVMRAVYADARLWLLSDGGSVSSLSPEQDKPLEATLPEPALDLCVSEGRAMVVTDAGADSSTWTLRRYEPSGWSTSAVVPTNGDKLLAMNCTAKSLTLLTTRRLVEIEGGHQRAIALSGEIGRGMISSTWSTPDQLFVGVNAGEWGGGLRRIDRHSGWVTTIERTGSAESCEGPLSTSCDPVNSIVAEPGKPGCLVAAIGLMHMGSHGRLVEVCGDNVKPFFHQPYGRASSNETQGSDEPWSSVAFFGLTSDGATMRAVGIDGIYSFAPAGPVQHTPLPRFRDFGGIGVSFDLPRVVLVLTDVNQRHAVSGSVPLLVERQQVD